MYGMCLVGGVGTMIPFASDAERLRLQSETNYDR